MDFFAFLARRGFRADNPLDGARKARPGKRKVKRGLTEDELVRIVFAALWMGDHGRRGTGELMAYAILAHYGLGLRPSEFLLLSKDRIVLDGASSCVYVVETKTGHDRAIPVVGSTREALERLIAMSPAESNRIMHIGTTRYWERFRAAAQLAGLPPEKCRPYALRHTTASHLTERGVPPRVVAEILGHSDLRSMMTYTQPSDQQMRDALGKLGLSD